METLMYSTTIESRLRWVSMPWWPLATPFQYSSLCSQSASSTCCGTVANQHRDHATPDCVVSSSLAPKDRFTPRYYVAALTDNMSLQKAEVYEQSLIQSDGMKTAESAHFMQIYRSREVGQSYITSIATTLLATLHAMWLVIRIRPQVIFCNGPGTCFPLCISAFLLKVLGLGWCSIFYIESIARVKKLSLSGLLLYKLRIADQFFVQWPQLQHKYPRACYAGRLM
uniref:UDP-N-acetylglucosamine transferase subunit ALG14 n=1 Tax=Zea mays TaxID=4577 RepID=B4FCW8_MAIZE|nr:unknown [Zea mays]